MLGPQIRRNVPVLGFVLVIALMSAVAGSGATRATGVRVGQPWTGAAGITLTTRQIMQQTQTPQFHHALPKFVVRLHRQPNPASPATTPDVALGATIAASPKLAVGANFTGATLNEESNDNGFFFVPPDSMGAVGPTQFLVAVNGKVKVFSKTGTLGALNTSLDSFFSSVLSSPPVGGGVESSDPHVRYDALSGRWIVTAIDASFNSSKSLLGSNRFMIAVSNGSTITNASDWTFFQFQQDAVSTTGDTGDFADFDTVGVDANALYMGANIFDPAGGYLNSSVFVIRKSSVTGGGPIVVTAFRDVNAGAGGSPQFEGAYTPQGVDNEDPAATTGYFVGIDGGLYGVLDVLRVGSPGGTPTLSANLQVTIPQDSIPGSVPASGSTRNLDGLDSRLTSSSIRDGKLYTVEDIAVNSSGVVPVDVNGNPINVDRDAARWYEVTNLGTTPSLNRSGTVFDSSTTKKSYWMPSIAVSPQGHAVMGMSVSASTLHPNAAFASMLSGTSSFSAPTTYTSASANYNVDLGDGDPTYRWGDYSHTSVDPCDGQTFWTIQEYVDGLNSWGVKVGQIKAPPPATPASTLPTSVNAGQASVSVGLTGTSASGSGFWDPGAGTCHVPIAAADTAVSGGVTINSVTYVDPTHLTLDVSTVGATGGAHTIRITNPDGQTAQGAVLTVNTAPANTALPTITGTTKVGSVLTSTTGTWTGFPTPTFTRQWERCDLAGANCSDIGGATGTTYTLVQADHGTTIRVKMTGTNTAGSATAESAQTTEIQYAPINTAVPTITGTVTKGQTLTAGTGTWDAFPSSLTFAYQWQRCTAPATCSNISGATASTYLLAQADVGLTIRVHVTATNTAGSTGADSAQTVAVTAAPANTALPTISGLTQVGATLTAANGTWTGSPTPTFTYQWEQCNSSGASCSNIVGETSSTYLVASGDAGHTIRVKVTGTNTVSSTTAESAATAVITVPPANTVLPSITGTATVGQVLTGNDGTWTGTPTPTLTRKWRRCDTGGANCVDIAGATGTTYTLVLADAGSTIRLHVTGTSTAGSTSADSAQTAVVTAAPANTALPTISGLTQVGATLTTSNGTWTGSPTPTFTYQWEQCNSSGASCSNLSGETNNTYLLTAGDAGHTIRVKVTATNTVTSTTAEAAATAVITVPPANTALPTITGTAAVGQMLTGNDGTWTGTPTPTLSRKWRRCDTGGSNCVDIAGATATTYTLVQADAGSTIRLHVTATSTSGTTTADSNATATVTGPPVVVTLPTITGTASRGQLLTAHNGTWSGFPAPTLTFQWRQCDSGGANCTDIGGATASTYTPVSGDQGKTLRVTETATNGSGTASASSNATAVVTGSPQNTAAPTLSGTAAKGQQLTTTNGTWTGFPATFTYTYAWFRCDSGGANCSAIGGATASSYTLVQADVGGTVKSQVTASNGVAPTASTDSAVTAVVTGAPANTAAPTITGTTGIGDTLTEHDGTWSGYPPPTFTYQWMQCDSAGENCSAITGETNNTYVIQGGDAGFRILVTVTATNTSGSASADSNTADVPGPVTNLALPTITGTAQVNATLTAHTGSWSGVPAPTFSYQWELCDAAGANCADIASATSATYHPVSGDVGSTIRVTVSGDNSGTPVPAVSAATPAVVAASSGGGGGGGSGIPPDVVASISASPANPVIGSTLTYTVQASILTGNATDVVATINLPAQVTFAQAIVNRGSGCTGTTTLTCDLSYLNGTLVATIQVVTQVTQAGTLVATASMTTTPGDSNTANNTATSTITVAAPPPPPPPPPPPLPAPVLKRIGRAPLVGVRHTRTETVDARFSTNEALRLSATVTPLRSTKKLTMLAKSRLAGTTATSSRLTLRGTARRSGAYAVHVVFNRKGLIHGHTYVIHLVGVNAKGKRTTLALRFKA